MAMRNGYLRGVPICVATRMACRNYMAEMPGRFFSSRQYGYTERARTEGIYGIAHRTVCRVRTVADGCRSDAGGRYFAASRAGLYGVWKLVIGRIRRLGLLGVGGERRAPIHQPGRSRGRSRNGQRQTRWIIPNAAGVHGIAFAAALKRGFTSNGRADTVSVFELDTLRVVREVPVSGKKPDAILYEPRQNHVITANGESANLSILDAATLQNVATVALPGPPEFMATDAAGMVYVNIETDPGKLVAVDGKSLAVKATWPLPGCSNPTGLAFDTVHHRLFSVCENQVMAVTDSVSGKQVARVVIGRGPDAVAFDSHLGWYSVRTVWTVR